MKKLLVIVLLIQILSLTCKDLITYAHFYLNQDYIVDNYCVNREIPEILCSGKCYLKKAIKENQQEHQEIPQPSTEKKTIPAFLSIQRSNLTSASIAKSKKKRIDYLTNTYSFTYLSRVFQPPQIAS